MKKLKKIELNDITLSKQEIEQLKGGVYAGDVTNENSVNECICSYKNRSSVIINDNSATTCLCNCI